MQMKRILSALILALVCATLSVSADDLTEFQGKWSVKKTSDQGTFTQFLEFTKNKWKFKMVGSDGNTVLVAEGNLELKEAGGVKIARLTDIKAGGSASDLNDTNDDRVSVYTFRDGKLILAGNFDKERNNEKPSMDEYSKVTK